MQFEWFRLNARRRRRKIYGGRGAYPKVQKILAICAWAFTIFCWLKNKLSQKQIKKMKIGCENNKYN